MEGDARGRRTPGFRETCRAESIQLYEVAEFLRRVLPPETGRPLADDLRALSTWRYECAEAGRPTELPELRTAPKT